MSRPDDHIRAPIGYTVSAWAAKTAPRSMLDWTARVGGFIHYWLSAEKRRNYLANTSPAIEFDRECPPWRSFQNQALNVFELLRASSQHDGAFLDRMTLHGGAHIDRALEKRRGLILTTFHSGNWELAGLMLARRGYPITTIAGEQLRAGWSDQVKNLKERFGIKMLGPNDPLRELYRDLQSNRVLVLHIDGDVFTGGHEVSFLGQTVNAPRGPARLARVLSSPVALAYCRRDEKGHLDVFVEPAIHPPTNTYEEQPFTQNLVTRVEKCIVDDPGQWCIFRRLQNVADRSKS